MYVTIKHEHHLGGVQLGHMLHVLLINRKWYMKRLTQLDVTSGDLER